jgi:hypothetical protein
VDQVYYSIVDDRTPVGWPVVMPLYAVVAIRDSEMSLPSAWGAPVALDAPIDQPLGSPGLTTTEVVSGGVQVEWSPAAIVPATVDGFLVYRIVPGVDLAPVQIGRVLRSTTLTYDFVDSSYVAGSVYFVRAFHGIAEGQPGNPSSPYPPCRPISVYLEPPYVEPTLSCLIP